MTFGQDMFAVTGIFQQASEHHLRYQWRFPKPCQWPQKWECQLQCDWADPTVAYASFWHQLEQQASVYSGRPIKQASKGRATTLEPVVRSNAIAPVKLGRENDIQPHFYGAFTENILGGSVNCVGFKHLVEWFLWVVMGLTGCTKVMQCGVQFVLPQVLNMDSCSGAVII